MRFFRPGIVVFCVALLASLCVHLPVYEALGDLAKTLLADDAPKRSAPVEFELTALDDKTVNWTFSAGLVGRFDMFGTKR